MAGVVFRVLLNYNAADLTLEGAFLAGLLAGPYTGALVGLLIGTPALIAGEFIAMPFAIGCGFAGGGLREACPKETIWQFTPFVFIDLHKHLWQMLYCCSPPSRWSCCGKRSAHDSARTGFSFSDPPHRG
jgi:two-component system LytT family sensor kinase